MIMKWCTLALLIRATLGYVHPITIHGHYFLDSVTKEPFYIKGVDYQPGGSSGVSEYSDPLSDPKICARDVILFQDLGINTIRIYSINPDLNHDVCMSLLATAGIYLVLDVNSPLPNQHLNRYEPWTTYNLEYLHHVFKVVEHFSYYNNTLGFFAGNEIINDEISAKSAPVYVKALTRDIKMYIQQNSPRPIPVGYSAADDLNYRIPLANYLTCVEDTPAEAVDFYGVNSYQWCGEQTFYTSGYNILVDDYSTYTRPVFFSEYGCNEVTPRLFEEVHSLYSTDMVDVFAGGLVYEFTQAPNKYGLVEVLPNGDVKVLEDFIQLKAQFEALPDINYNHIASSMKKNAKEMQSRLKTHSYVLPECEISYENLDISKGLPPTVAEQLIKQGVKVKQGSYVELNDQQLISPYKALTVIGANYDVSTHVVPVVNINSGVELKRPNRFKGGFDNCTYETDSDYSEYSDYSDSDGQGGERSMGVVPRISRYFQNLFKSISKKLFDD